MQFVAVVRLITYHNILTSNILQTIYLQKKEEKKRMKELLQFLLGIVLMIAGGVMFLKNVVVPDWGLLSSLFRIGGGVSIGGIFIVLLVIAFIALLVLCLQDFALHSLYAS